MSDVTGPSTPGSGPEPAAGAPAAPAAGSTLPSLSSLDPAARMVVAAGIAAAVVLLVGGVLGAWVSTEFLLIGLAASLIAAGAPWLQSMLAESAPEMSVAAPLVGVLAAAVVAVLGIFNAIELLFDLDQVDDIGAAVAVVALALAGAVLLVASLRRFPEARAAVRSTAIASRLALAGLALVLIGWAINLASYWTMTQATRSLAIVTLAALIVLLAGRALPSVAAWFPMVLGLVGAAIALEHWRQLQRLGEEQFELGITDYLPFLLYALGVVLVIAAGALAGVSARPVIAPPTTASTPRRGG